MRRRPTITALTGTVEIGTVVEDRWAHLRWVVTAAGKDTLDPCSADSAPQLHWYAAPRSLLLPVKS
jgi:hypothetical protein